jgi:hypothetical protein
MRCALDDGAIETVTHGRRSVEVTPVLLNGRTCKSGIRKHAADFRAAEKVAPQLAPTVNVRATPAGLDCLFNCRRSAGLQYFADDSS